MNKLKAEFPQRKAESEQHWLERLRRRGEKRQRAAALAATPAAAPPAAAPLAAIAPPAVAPVVAAPPAWYVPGWRSRSYEEIREAELLQHSGGEIQASPTYLVGVVCAARRPMATAAACPNTCYSVFGVGRVEVMSHAVPQTRAARVTIHSTAVGRVDPVLFRESCNEG